MHPNAPEFADKLLIREFITRALAEYGTNPAVPSIMQEISIKAPAVFVREAFLHLQSGFQSPGHRQLATLLVKNPDAISLVANPAFLRLDEAVVASKRLMEVDSLFDVKLARQVPGRDSADGVVPEAVGERILDIVNAISTSGRVVPILGHLTEHPSSRLAAKATLVLGRLIHNSSWIGRHLRSADPRVRANALEALWGIDSPGARGAFNSNLLDPNNRVVGNAVLGLHLIKAANVTEWVDRMLENGSPLFRGTAAWLMGKTAQPEFVDKLHKLMRDDTPAVRSAALRALFSIRKVLDASGGALREAADQEAATVLPGIGSTPNLGYGPEQNP